MVELEELQLDASSGDFIFQALITLGLGKKKKNKKRTGFAKLS